jgi:tetratricopeptide (TPR) repeat protein
MKAKLSILQLLALFTLLVALLAASWGAIRIGFLDFQFMKSRAVIERWKDGTPPTIKLWGKTANDLKEALEANPNDPQIAESLGYLYALQAMRSAELPELKMMLLDESISYFRTSTRLRPMSPYAWSNLALALHEKNDDSDEMWHAFDRAMRYGQREIAVQKQLAEIAFARWSDIGEVRQEQMRKIVTGVGDDYKEALLDIAERNSVRGLLDGH